MKLFGICEIKDANTIFLKVKLREKLKFLEYQQTYSRNVILLDRECGLMAEDLPRTLRSWVWSLGLQKKSLKKSAHVFYLVYGV